MGGYNYDQDPDFDWKEALRRLEPQPEPQSQPSAAPANQDWQRAYEMLQKQQATPAMQPEAPPKKDDAKTYWAMALSLLGNHGRDLGSVLQASSDEYNKRLGAWEARQGQLREIEARKASDPFAQLLAVERLKLAGQNAGLRDKDLERKIANTAHQNEQKENADSATRLANVEETRRKASAGVEGKTQAQTDLADQIDKNAEDLARSRASGTTQGTTDELRSNPRAVTEQEKLANARADEQLAETKRAREVNEAIRAGQVRQTQINDFNNKYGAAIETLNAAENLQKLIGDSGDIEGVGPIVGSRFMPDALKSDEALKEQQAFAAFQNPGFLARSGKAVTPQEAGRLEAEFGNLKSTNPEVVRNAVKAIAETMRNTLKRGSVGREDIAREILSSQHLDDVLGPAVVDDAPASARDALPQTGPRPDVSRDTITGDPMNLGDTGGRRDVPAMPSDARAGGTVQLKLPSGRTIRANLTPDQLQQAIAGGAELL